MPSSFGNAGSGSKRWARRSSSSDDEERGQEAVWRRDLPHSRLNNALRREQGYC